MRSALGTLARTFNRAPVPYAPRHGSLLGGLTSQRGDPVAQMEAMGSVGTLFAIVNRSSNAVSMVHWNLTRKTRSDAEPTILDSHAAIDLLHRPNPHMTGQLLFETTQQHIDLVGEGYWVIVRGRRARMPLELWPVRPDRIVPVPSATEFIAGYVYVGPDGEKVPLDVEDVICFKMPNPVDPYRGMGPVQAILADIDAARYTAEWNRNFFLNSAEPGGIIEMDRRLSDDEWAEFTSRWREQHQGVANAHRVAVLENGGKWVDRKFSMRDMQFTELRNVSRDIMREAFGFSKTMLGQTEDVNRATAEAAEYVFSAWHLVPRLERYKGALNTELLPAYGGSDNLKWAYEDPVPANREADNAERDSRVTGAIGLAQAGWDPAGALEAMGLPEIPYTGQPDGGGADAQDAGASPAAVARLAQQLYIATPHKQLMSAEEARQLLNEAGADLTGPPPDPPPAPGPNPVGSLNGPLGPTIANRLTQLRRLRGDIDDEDPPPQPSTAPPDGLPDTLPTDQQPDLAPVQEAWEQALDSLIDEWAQLEAAQKAELVSQVREIIASGDLTQLAVLEVGSDDAAQALEAAMTSVAGQAAEQVAAEADDQGVSIDPVAADAGEIADVASVVAAVRASALAGGTAMTAMRAWGPEATPESVTEAVEAHLEGLSPEGPRPTLGGALTGAQNSGRIATLRSAPEGALYANEVNDTNTCSNCREVDGRWLGNVSDMDRVMKSYPGGGYGGYVYCLGRERCRGTVTGVWRPRQTGD